MTVKEAVEYIKKNHGIKVSESGLANKKLNFKPTKKYPLRVDDIHNDHSLDKWMLRYPP